MVHFVDWKIDTDTSKEHSVSETSEIIYQSESWEYQKTIFIATLW